MLKKLTATGILAAAATGVVLLGGAAANADQLSNGRTAAPANFGCLPTVPGAYTPALCAPGLPVTLPAPAPVYAPPVYAPPVYYPRPYYPRPYYPGYHYGWDRWHHYHR